MPYYTDKDGKSKTASAVDDLHYPEQHEAIEHDEPEPDEPPSWDQINTRAHQLWAARGCPEGDAEKDWLQAEADLKRESAMHAPVKGVPKQSGSVQA